MSIGEKTIFDSNINIPMPPVNTNKSLSDCTRCDKKSVCKYYESLEKIRNKINDMINDLDEDIKNPHIEIDVACKEFNSFTLFRNKERNMT